MANHYETIIQLIKAQISDALNQHVDFVAETGINVDVINIQVEPTRNQKFGDYATNVIMSFGLERTKTMEFAKLVASSLSKKYFSAVHVVEPGFINMVINPEFNNEIIDEIIKGKDDYGNFKPKKTFYNIEFVSANPTGLLHIGHARNAAIGDSLARIWHAYGLKLNREYYINDAGNQIEKLAMSVLIRYKQALGINEQLPEDSYHGEEIIDVANEIKFKNGDKYINLQHDNSKIIGDEEGARYFKNFSKDCLLTIIKQTLNNFGVKMDIWFSELSIYENKLIDVTIKLLKDHTYEKDGALWLRTTEYGDDKDRVIVKSDGTYTYFLPDIAYHNIKLSRGYDKIFNIWGSDHKSYADRMQIAVQLLGYKKDQIETLIMQMVRLVKDGQEFKMSKRSGNSLTLQDLLDTIGKDAARWYLVSQSLSSHIEIDVNKATNKNSDNPLYYVQYAHARINQLAMKVNYSKPKSFHLLSSPTEVALINSLHLYKHTIESVAKNYEINKFTLYLTNLAKTFHAFYTANKVIDPSNELLSAQRLYLSLAVKQVIKNGLSLLGITAVDQM